MKKILLVIIILAGNWSTAQIDIRYKFSDGQVFSKQIFDALVKTFDKQNLEYKITDSVITTSTLTRIVDIKTKGYYAAKENNTVFDPYATFKLNKGKEFKISDFLDDQGKNISENKLKGKPTIINFWFTSCAPCIAELPHLLKLKSKFGEKLNYLAVTFDSKIKVDTFLNKNEFDFLHITNATIPIKNLGISSYPMTYILDNQGKIFEIYGGITDFEYKQIYNMIENDLL